MGRLKRHNPNWGGARPGAGRKPKGDRALVSHKARPRFGARTPLHVVLRLSAHVRLTNGSVRRAVLEALREGRELHGLHVVELGRLKDQLHFIAEADNNASLSRGMQGLSIRIAKGINRAIGGKGSIFADHFEAFVLRSPKDVRHAREPVRWEHPEGVVSPARVRLLR